MSTLTHRHTTTSNGHNAQSAVVHDAHQTAADASLDDSLDDVPDTAPSTSFLHQQLHNLQHEYHSLRHQLLHLYHHPRQTLHQLLSLLLIVSSAVMIWKSLILVSGSESPVVVVLSGSMEPAFYRGDILFLSLPSPTSTPNGGLEVGDIVVFKVKGREVPIVHRIHELHSQPINSTYNAIEMLTKGDNNPTNDRGLYNVGQMWLSRDDIIGKAVGYLPYLGQVTIQLTDHPIVKYVLIGIMGIFVVTSKE